MFTLQAMTAKTELHLMFLAFSLHTHLKNGPYRNSVFTLKTSPPDHEDVKTDSSVQSDEGHIRSEFLKHRI